jgi:hypothetical protein
VSGVIGEIHFKISFLQTMIPIMTTEDRAVLQSICIAFLDPALPPKETGEAFANMLILFNKFSRAR